jgi:hypothetical protein
VIIIIRVAQTSKKFQLKKSTASKSSCANPNSNSCPLKTNKSEGLLSVLGSDVGKNGQMPKSPSAISGFNFPMKTSNSKKVTTSEDKFSLRTRNLALMLIPVNILFLMFMAPVVITMYIYENLFEDKLTLAIVELLSYCNFSINFIIYFLTSSKFREEFFKLMNECSSKFQSKNGNLTQINTTSTKVFNYNTSTSNGNKNIQSNKITNDSNKINKLNIPLITINKSHTYDNEDQDKLASSLFKCLQETYNETHSLMEKTQETDDIKYLDDDENQKETEFK